MHIKTLPGSRIRSASILIAVHLSLLASAQDRAIMVGIDRYPHLQDATLRGCENDADTWAKTLLIFGFGTDEQVVLKSEKATKSAILSELRKAVETLPAGGRIFYAHSGHGSQLPNGEATLLTADSGRSEFNGDLLKEDFASIARAASQKKIAFTFIVDACHSEGVLSKNDRGLDKERSRVYLRPKSSRSNTTSVFAKLPEIVSLRSRNKNLTFTDEEGFVLAQYAAAAWMQKAKERPFEGKSQGVFTYYLAKALAAQGPKSTWPQVIAEVNGSVGKASRDEQIPVYTGYPGVVFSSGVNASEGTFPAQNVVTLKDWGQLYSFSNKNESKLKMELLNEQGTTYQEGASLRVKGSPGGEQYSKVSLSVGADGYLVVFDRDAKDDIAPLNFSLSDNIDDILSDCRVINQDKILLPGKDGEAYRYNYVGPEQIRALLFTEESVARRALEMLKKVSSKSRFARTEMARLAEVVTVKLSSGYTADLRFNVVK